jgi:membrane protein implicated in regulation of membrane protease activity
LGFGVRSAVWGTVALLWPLILSLVIGNLTATIVFYVVAMLLDAVLFAVWLRRALGYSKRASRGETFAIRTVTQPQTRGIPAKH